MRLILVILCFLNTVDIVAQMPNEFDFSTTNSSGTLLGQVQLNGMYADSEDWIAAFDESGVCCGASQIIMDNGISYINLSIYGDDATTVGVDEGVNNGESFSLKLFDASSNSIFDYEIDGDLVLLQNWNNTNGAPMPGYSNPNDVYQFSYLQIDFNQTISACENGEGIVLTGGFPEGGVYSGIGVVGGVFYPSVAQAGTHSITYTANNQEVNINAVVHPIVTPNIVNNGPFCSNDQQIALEASVSGGVFSGQGVVNNFFNPSLLTAGTYLINYEVEDSNQCNLSSNSFFEVFQAPVANIITDGFLLSSDVTVGGMTEFLWSTGETSSQISVSESGDYWLIVNDDVCVSDTVFAQVELSHSNIIQENSLHYNFEDKRVSISNIQNRSNVAFYNLSGQKLFDFNVKEQTQFWLNQYPSGVYILVITSHNHQFSKKISL